MPFLFGIPNSAVSAMYVCQPFSYLLLVVPLTLTRSQSFTDPQWSNGDMWYWQSSSPMGVSEAWSMGYTGSGVNIAILDDGVATTISDVQPNYVADLSYDYAASTTIPGPKFSDTHGTRVATVAAGARNNSVCGCGVAPNAGIVGVRLFGNTGGIGGTNLPLSRVVSGLTGTINNKERHVHTHVFVASWGATDSGSALYGPDAALIAAQRTVAYQGRSGLGAMIVISAGNGGTNSDDCAADGFVQGPYVLTVQAVSRSGTPPSFTEPCSAAFTSAYVDSGLAASNAWPQFGAACTNTFGGTSAAAPVVGGIVALALEAKPSLSRRDVLHLLVQASKPGSLNSSVTWQQNAAGWRFNSRFGFGLLNASRLVELAASSSPQRSASYGECTVVATSLALSGTQFNAACSADLTLVEYATLTFSLTAPKRGDVELWLLSPNGTQVQLLTQRTADTNTAFANWTISTPFFWDESPDGTWTLTVTPNTASLTQASITLFGEPVPTPETTTTAKPTAALKDWQVGVIVAAVGVCAVCCFFAGRALYKRSKARSAKL